MSDRNVKSAAESLLFIWGEPLEAKTLAELFNLPVAEIMKIMRDLAREYEEKNGGLLIRQLDKSFQFVTNPENDDYIRKLCTPVKEKRLSQSALEVLAVVAYKQPVTKSEIDAIRGIRSDRVIEGLLKRELIEEKGRSTAIGRPILYGTTRNFLALFGFESLAELPELDDIETLMPAEGEEELLAGQLRMEMSGRQEQGGEDEEADKEQEDENRE
ncbi:MAG: SMC-Scp complex subunit ScpB [Firmicutes bacterium]|jgi:segregation and condensation protein B|nr:SMC-Scp complex subunit ScpB [Bacillota bacterium]